VRKLHKRDKEMVEKQTAPVVIDCGEYSVKAGICVWASPPPLTIHAVSFKGFGGEDAPLAVFPNAVGRHRYTSRGELTFFFPSFNCLNV